MNRTLLPQQPSRFTPQPIRIIHTQCACGELVRVDVRERKPPQRAVCANCLPPTLAAQESALYPLEVNLDGSTRHSHLCTGAFGRYDLHCRRCLELRAGAARRDRSHRKHLLGQQHLAL